LDLINPLAPFLLNSHARMAPIARFEKMVLFWRASGFTGQAYVRWTPSAREEISIAITYKWLYIVCRRHDMPLLQVRDFPEDIYKKISISARRQNRTIAQQIIVLLEKSLGQQQSNIERRKQILEKIKMSNVPVAAQKTDAVILIREDRDR